MQAELIKRDLDLGPLVLKSGAHSGPQSGYCVMEAVAYVAGEEWSDSPQCACPVLAGFMRNWNDSLDDEARQRLKPYILRLIGTHDGNELRRSWMAFDWLTRECTPAFMDLTPSLQESAATLRALPEVADKDSLDAAMTTIQTAAKAADAAWDAAWDAAGTAAWAAGRAAAGAAAGAAAWDAARATARDAARDAARAAARDAARAAAWDAAGAVAGAARDAAGAAAGAAAGRKLAPIVARLQDSAFALIERMLALPKGQQAA